MTRFETDEERRARHAAEDAARARSHRQRCITCRRWDTETTFSTKSAVYCTDCTTKWDLSEKWGGDDQEEDDDQ